MDKNEELILNASKKENTPLRFYLDNGICINSPVIEVGESELILVDERGNEMCLSKDVISSIGLN